MDKFIVINLNDKDQWSDVINACVNFDFYHTHSYNVLEESGKPVLLVQYLGDELIAFPIIVRDIPNTNYLDCTSVYGYSGPISNKNFSNLSKDILCRFNDNVIAYFNSQKIVSCFSRLHPVFGNQKVLENFGETLSLNKTIAIDLSLPIDEQRKKYRKSNKYEINKLKKNSFTVVEATTDIEINEFIDIYTDTMKRVGASDAYFFSKEYFFSFLKNESFEAKLLLAKKEGEITAGAIFTIVNGVMQYHLAGTKLEFSRDTPMKLILDEARLKGSELNLKFLHLGGGVGGSDEDSLYRFKSGFSDLNFTYNVWQYVVDKKAYNTLVKEVGNENKESGFFPLYRA